MPAHDWDASVYGTHPRDMLIKGRRVCRRCGIQQKKFDDQSWGRVVGYHWEPRAGRCRGEQMKPGDLIEFNGKRLVVCDSRGIRVPDGHVHAVPATKTGKADRRFEGGWVPIGESKVIKPAAS